MDYLTLLKTIMDEGKTINPRGEEVKELMHVQLEVDENIFAFSGVRELDFILNYWRREWAWYMTGDRLGTQVEPYAKLWTRIKNEDKTLNSNYGHLVFYNTTPHPSLSPQIKAIMTPFQWAHHSLKNDMNSRQAMITYNTGGFNFEGNKDYICTQHQAFFIRNLTLDCYIALRSSDAIFGLTYNMPWWSFVHQTLYHCLRDVYPTLMLGKLKVTIYSAHIYQPHYGLVSRMIDCDKISLHHATVKRLAPLYQSFDFYFNNFNNFIEIKNSSCVFPSLGA